MTIRRKLMKKLERQDFKLAKDKEKVALTLQRSVKEMEDKLKRMGLERPRHGPRISDPRHTRNAGCTYSPSSELRVFESRSN